MSDSAPLVVVSRRGAARLRAGHPWVFRSDLEREPEAAAGDAVRVTDPRGNFIGHAFYSSSQLALRLLGREAGPPGPELFRRRIEQALMRRRTLLPGREALRLVHGESDLLPGLLVDRFADGVVLQTLCQATDRREDLFVQILVDLLRPRVVVARNDGSTRDYEGLERHRGILFPAGDGADAVVRYREGDILFSVDLLNDQKTGGYLDQHDNRLLAGRLARGRVLDLFCYHGGFGLQMARQAQRVLCVEINEQAVQRVKENARTNGITNVETCCANAFDHLRLLESQKASFDVIVVDPPSFAKRRSALEGARRGYKELNLRALRLLEPGGLLLTCSCSAKVTPDLFEEVVLDAARDARRSLALLERRGAGPDHPGLLGVPETEYLKCLVLQAVA